MKEKIGSTLNKNAALNNNAVSVERTLKYLHQRIKECVQIDKNELLKRASDNTDAVRKAIETNSIKLEQQLITYVDKNISEIITNKYEILHISELEARSTDRLYRQGSIVREFQHILIFKRK